jgi:hypothetical protein
MPEDSKETQISLRATVLAVVLGILPLLASFLPNNFEVIVILRLLHSVFLVWDF